MRYTCDENTGLSHLFKWENLHNWWLTKYFFASLYKMDVGYMSTPETLLHVQGLWPWALLTARKTYLNSDLIIASGVVYFCCSE